MKDTLLTKKQKAVIETAIKKPDYKKVIAELDKVSTKHSGTAKMKDKRYVIAEIVRHITDANHKNPAREFYKTGLKILDVKSDNAKETGIHVLWRAYSFNKPGVTKWLYRITDDENWEVREYAAGALAETLRSYPGFNKTLRKWTRDKSENIRRGVVLAAVGLRNRKDPGTFDKMMLLLEPLLYDSSVYVKKNLGPFILGSYYGNAFPGKMFECLDRIIKIKDENVRWNAAMVFNNSFGHRHQEEARKYLKILSEDTRLVVRRAVKSAINHLNKRISK